MQSPPKNLPSLVWEYDGYSKEHQLASRSGGVFDLRSWNVVQVMGPDAADYLQRMSTQDFRKMKTGEVLPGLFLTGKAVPIVGGYFLKKEENVFLFIVSPGQGELAYEHMEKFHFQENLQIEQVSKDYALVGFWKLKPPSSEWQWQDPFRADLNFWLTEPAKAQALLEKSPKLGYRLFEFYRLEAGVVWVGHETDEKTLALEAGLDKSISEQKGCYPGQEVVERIRTYGQVNRRLAKLELQSSQPLHIPCELSVGEPKAPIGLLVAADLLPDDPDKAYGMAYLKRAFLDSHKADSFEVFGVDAAGHSVKTLCQIR